MKEYAIQLAKTGTITDYVDGAPIPSGKPKSDPLRNYLRQIVKDNPINLDIIEDIGKFSTRKAAGAWTARLVASGNLTEVGTMKDANGRKVIPVYCNGWKPKDDNLRHEIIGTWVRLLYPVFHFRRGPKINDCLPDMVMTDGEHTYEFEVDCDTMPMKKVKYRWKAHKCEHDILVVTAPEHGDPEARLKQLLDWSEDLGERGFFTTFDRLRTLGPHARVWDFYGRKGELKRVKLPAATAFQVDAQDTPQTAIGQRDEGGNDDEN